MRERSPPSRPRAAIAVAFLLAAAGVIDLFTGRSGSGGEGDRSSSSVGVGAATAQAPAEEVGSAQGGSEEPSTPAALGPAPLASDPPEERIGPPPFPAPHRIAPERLGEEIMAVLRRGTPARVRTAVCVVRADDGRVLWRRLAGDLRPPASNTKLLTTASALVHLGPSFRFTTTARSRVPIGNDGRLAGDLYVVGDGDPDDPGTGLDPVVLRLARALAAAGLRSIRGDVIVDDRIFDRSFVHPSWNPHDLDDAFAAPVAGFSYHANFFAVSIVPSKTAGVPAQVFLDPPLAPFDVRASVRTEAKGRHLIDVRPGRPGPGPLEVRGRTVVGAEPEPIERAVGRPILVACAALERALRSAGIEIVGRVRPVDESEPPPPERILARVETPLSALLPLVNKDSNNVVAEHVFKRAGAAVSGVGTFATGSLAVARALEVLGVDARGGASADGSGLSHDNRWCAETIAELLTALHRSRFRDAFERSLAVGGRDGTLARRFGAPRLRGRVLAKSGFIRGVSALSGFTRDDEGGWLAFSILMRGLAPGENRRMKKVQEEVVALLTELEPAR